MGAVIELGRLRDRLAHRMFPTDPVNSDSIDDYLTAATHIATHAGSIARDRASDPLRLHSFMGPLGIAMRRMHATAASADPAMEDFPLLAATFVNLYDVAHRYATTLERRHRIADGLPTHIRHARDAMNVLCEPDAINAETVGAALAAGAALLPELPGHNPADDLADDERTHGVAHRDRAAQTVQPLADLLRPHLPADVDADAVARYVVAEHDDPFVALRVVRSLCAGLTGNVSLEDAVRGLASMGTAAQRRDGLAAEKTTAITVLRGLGSARRNAVPATARSVGDASAPAGPRNIYADDLPYAIDSDVFWLGVTGYRDEFFVQLAELTELLEDRDGITAALTDRWTRTITPARVTAFVDDVGERLTHLGIASQQLAGVQFRMADPESGTEHTSGVAFSQLGDEIVATHVALQGLNGRADELAAMSFDVSDEQLDATLDDVLGPVRWTVPLWRGLDPQPEVPFTETPLAHASATLTAEFGGRQEKIVDPHRLGRYFGFVAEARHRELPTEREEIGAELVRRRELAQDGANIMLHAGVLHPEAVPAVAQRIIGLVDDMETLTVALLRNPEQYGQVVRDGWEAVRKHVERVMTAPDPTESRWRRGYERRVERAVETAFQPWKRRPRNGDTAPVETSRLPGFDEAVTPEAAAPDTDGPVEADTTPAPPDEEVVNDPALPPWLQGLPQALARPGPPSGTRAPGSAGRNRR